MSDELRNKRIAFLTANTGVEQIELTSPWSAVERAGAPVAVICHGPWTLIEADVVKDRTLTSWPSVRTDLENAGATWVDEDVVVCSAGPNTLVSRRKPDDLPAFERALTASFARQD